jgi:two-component system response regulator DegU
LNFVVDLVQTPQPGHERLTQRERDTLRLLAQGKDNLSIAQLLGIAEGTVKNYIVQIYDKLGVCSQVEAVLWAQRRGLF